MKGFILNLVFFISILCLSSVFAVAKSNHWICTTNASSATNAKEQEADNKMKNTAGAASSSFSFALKNCRDCTKITCDLQNK